LSTQSAPVDPNDIGIGIEKSTSGPTNNIIRPTIQWWWIDEDDDDYDDVVMV